MLVAGLGIEFREPLIASFQNPKGEKENDSENKSQSSVILKTGLVTIPSNLFPFSPLTLVLFVNWFG